MQAAEWSNKTPLRGKLFKITWIDPKINLTSIQIQGTWTLESLWERWIAKCWGFFTDHSSRYFHFSKTGTCIHTENQKRRFHCPFLWRMVGKHVPDTTAFTRSATPAWKNDLSRTDPGLNFYSKAWLLPCHCRTPGLWEQRASSQPGTQHLKCCTKRCWSAAVPTRKALRLCKVSFKILFIRASTIKIK